MRTLKKQTRTSRADLVLLGLAAIVGATGYGLQSVVVYLIANVILLALYVRNRKRVRWTVALAALVLGNAIVWLIWWKWPIR